MAPTTQARRTALRHSRALERLERIGIKALPGVARTIRVAVLTAYERSEDLGAAIYAALEQFEAILRDAMVAGHLQGHLRSIQTVAAVMAERSKAAGPYDQAVEFMQRRLALRPEQIELLEGLYGPEAVRVTREVGGVLEAKAQRAAAEITARGMHVRQGIAEMRTAFDAAGVSPVQPHLLETLVRTQTHMAYGAGRWNANQDPTIDEILWGYEYVTVGDDRVRPNHQALRGTKLPKDHPRWGEIWPPNGFNCLPPETLVTTTRGGVPIDEIVHGDLVLTHKGRWRAVIELHRNKGPHELVVLNCENGRTLRATGNHRIFTKRGWINASLLDVGDEVLHISIASPSRPTIGNVEDVIQFQGVTDGAMAEKIGPVLMPLNLYAYPEFRKEKIQPIASRMDTEDLLDAQSVTKSRECSFVRTHDRARVGMLSGVPLIKVFLGHRHFVPHFGASGGCGNSQRASGTASSIRMLTMMDPLAFGERAFFESMCSQYSNESPVVNASYASDVCQADCVTLVAGEGLRQSARPRAINSLLGTGAIRSASVGLLSHGATIVATSWQKLKRISRIGWGRQLVYNLGVEEDQSYCADGYVVHNCRCETLEVFDEGETVEPPAIAEVDGGQVVPGADVGFDFNPGQVYQGQLGPIPAKKLRPAKPKRKPRAKVKRKPPKKQIVEGIPTEANGKVLTKKDKRVIYDYTSYSTQDMVAAQLGKPLPSWTKLSKAQLLKEAEQIESALKKVPGVKKRSYRGLKFDTAGEQRKFFSEFKKGGTYEFRAFQSSSSDKNVTKRFMGRQPPDRTAKMVIDGKSGRDVMPLSYYTGEKEILFLKGARFKVTKVIKNTIYLVEL